VPEVVGQEHGGHAPTPELALDLVSLAQGLSELRGWCGHLLPLAGDASNLAE
jgi:hypothetical protein